jgi:succinate dehydrogenase/fumarate reductase flavoprotein subunit
VRVASDAAQALSYLVRSNGDTAPAAVLETLAQGMTALPAYVRDLAKAAGASVMLRPGPANYPFPGYDTFGFVEIEGLADFDAKRTYPHVEGAPGGAKLFHVIERNLAARKIAARVKTRAEQLVRAEDGGVAGLVVSHNGSPQAIRARKGVVLACGGFEGDAELQRQFWPEGPVLSAAYRANTGDGIRMAQMLGADLWHMWHYHGSYGFKHPDVEYPFGIRTKRLPDWIPGKGAREDIRMPWILLDRRGRRFMNEYDPYLQDTGARPFVRYDPLVQDYAARPAWLVADSAGAALWPFGRPTWHEPGVGFEWGRDNERALQLGILRKAWSVEELAAATGLPAAEVAQSLARWNELVAQGADHDQGRPPSSMVEVKSPPYVYAPVWPIVSNTQGGPVHDARQRVLRPDGSAIPRLYAAGELGSVFGHLYMSGGNIAECFVGGLIAGREAAAG